MSTVGRRTPARSNGGGGVTPRGVSPYARTASAGSHVSRGSRAPSANSEVAFGRRTPSAKREWDSTSYVGGGSETPYKKAPPLHHFTPEEICGGLDAITIGGPSGSVRLQRFTPSTGSSANTASRVRSSFQVPYSLQDPVILTVYNGMVQISKAIATSIHNSGARPDVADAFAVKGEEIALIPVDHLSQVELTASGIACAGRGGLDLALTIHNGNKKNVLYKLLTLKSKGIVPSTPEEELQAKEDAKPHPPSLTSVAVPLVRDVNSKAKQIKAIEDGEKFRHEEEQRRQDEVEAPVQEQQKKQFIDDRRSEPSMASATTNEGGPKRGSPAPRSRSGQATPRLVPTTTTSSITRGKSPSKGGNNNNNSKRAPNTADGDRQARRDVLYAQLRDIRQREATRASAMTK